MTNAELIFPEEFRNWTGSRRTSPVACRLVSPMQSIRLPNYSRIASTPQSVEAGLARLSPSGLHHCTAAVATVARSEKLSEGFRCSVLKGARAGATVIRTIKKTASNERRRTSKRCCNQREMAVLFCRDNGIGLVEPTSALLSEGKSNKAEVGAGPYGLGHPHWPIRHPICGMYGAVCKPKWFGDVAGGHAILATHKIDGVRLRRRLLDKSTRHFQSRRR